MTHEKSQPVERIHRAPRQLMLVILARPSVWTIWLGAAIAGYSLLALVLPHWVWSIFGTIYVLGVVTPLAGWRMRVLDARAVAEGEPAIPEPRQLPLSALDPVPAAARATVDGALRRLIRSCWLNGAGLLVIAVPLSSAVVLLHDPRQDVPRWIIIPMACVVVGWTGWLAFRVIPRFLAAARQTRDGLLAGAVPRHAGRITRVSGFRPVVEIAGSEIHYEVFCHWTAPRGVRADDEVSVLGEWRRGAVVLVLSAGSARRPKSYWGELRPAD